jgi:uncharacterized protein YidB (DUF937 family)
MYEEKNMIDALLKNLSKDIGPELISKAGISENKLGELFKVTGNVASQEITKQATAGGMDNLMNLFSNKPNNPSANSIQNNIVNGLIASFTSKLGLSQQQAQSASGIIVPALMNLITKKNSETPESDPSPLMKMFDIDSGKKGAGKIVGDMLGKFMKK